MAKLCYFLFLVMAVTAQFPICATHRPLSITLCSSQRNAPNTIRTPVTTTNSTTKNERTVAGGGNVHPVVLVPGTGGNQLEARLTSEYKATSLICRRWFWERSWFTIWFDISVIIPPFTKCFADRMKLLYDRDQDEYSNVAGVETRVPYFGSTKGMQFLDSDIKCITSYMSALVKSLEDAGYVDGESLYGAPYDFRYGPGTKAYSVGTVYVENLKKLVEDAYLCNGNRSVILVSHSLGGLWLHHLLISQSLEWKQKYIKHFVAIGTPWGGTVQAMRTIASGYNLDILTVNPLDVREEQRSSESNLWLLPVPEVFNNRTLVTKEGKSYSALDMTEFLKDIGFSEGVKPYQSRIRPLTRYLEAPQVPVTIIHGSGVKTPEMLKYDSCGFDKQPEIVNGDGDGSVNLLSLTAVISQWSADQNEGIKVIEAPESAHEEILKDEKTVEMIVAEILRVGTSISADSLVAQSVAASS